MVIVMMMMILLLYIYKMFKILPSFGFKIIDKPISKIQFYYFYCGILAVVILLSFTIKKSV